MSNLLIRRASRKQPYYGNVPPKVILEVCHKHGLLPMGSHSHSLTEASTNLSLMTIEVNSSSQKKGQL